MNRTLIIIKLAVWSVIGLFATVLLIRFISVGAFFNFQESKDSAGFSEIKSQTLTEDINRIDIIWAKGEVEIFKSDNEETMVVQKARNGSKIEREMIVDLIGDKILIDQNIKKWRFWLLNSDANRQTTHLELYLPEKVYDTVKIRNVSGDVFWKNAVCKRLEIESVSSDIYLSGHADETDLKTVSGAVKADSFICPIIKSKTVSGDLRITGEFNNINLETVSGDAQINSSTMLNAFRSKSVSGDVNLHLPENDGFEFSFKKVSGSFWTDFETTMQRDTFTYGNGNARLNSQTVSGDVSIRKR